MKSIRMIVASAIATTLAVGGLAGCGGGSESGGGKSLTIWDYEDANSAQGQAWSRAVEIFKAEHPGVTVKFEKHAFTSTDTAAKVILAGNNVPDVLEYNKGTAAGELASLGLITPLTDAVTKYHWDKVVNTPALQLLARYDHNGVAGTGDWYGIPNYGEYILWYYNKDYFDQHQLTVPTTRAQLDTLLKTIKSEGVTPISASAKEFPYIHTWFQYVLRDAPADWVKCYQLFQCPVDFSAPYWTDGTAAAEDLVTKGYESPDITGITHEQMGVNFLSKVNPLMMSGSWWYGRLATEATFNWGTFLAPQQNLNQGSIGNLWVVPTKAKNKDLAYQFIDITLRPEVQNLMGEKGGLPLAGDPSAIQDARTQAFTKDFQALASGNKLAFYPDFPIPGFVDELFKDSQIVANRSKSPADVVALVKAFYDAGRKNVQAGK